MLRNVVLSVATLVLGLTGFTAQAQAAASAAQCEAMLGDVESARESMESLERSLDEVDAERVELTGAMAGLERRIAAAQAKGQSIMALRAELDAMHLEVSLIDDLRPELVAQLDALKSSIDSTERSYIACIETVVGG